MLKTIIWFAYLWLNLLLPRYKLVWLNWRRKTTERDATAQLIARRLARSVIAFNGSVIKVSGLENVPPVGGVLYIANHQSNFDIPIFIGYVPRDKGFIAKQELLKLPTLGSWMKYLGCVIINRNDPRQSLNAISLAAERIKGGHSLVIFPEGTRTKDGTVGQFKPGSLRIALKAQVPIVPVTINGSMDIMPKGTAITKAASVQVIISPPLSPDEQTGMDSNALAEKVRSIIIANFKTQA